MKYFRLATYYGASIGWQLIYSPLGLSEKTKGKSYTAFCFIIQDNNIAQAAQYIKYITQKLYCSILFQNWSSPIRYPTKRMILIHSNLRKDQEQNRFWNVKMKNGMKKQLNEFRSAEILLVNKYSLKKQCTVGTYKNI